MSTYNDDDRVKLAWAEVFPLIALTLLGMRFVQGFIFWGGASRRLIYDFHEVAGVDLAVKLDFDAAGFVAAKLVHALPGALWVQGPIEWTLAHPALVDASVWAWTFAELAVGLGLIFGLFTRLLALASVGLNIALMMIFGWMGSTCLDEWTMAVSGLAMSAAVVIAGGGGLSLDRLLMGRATQMGRRSWLTWLTSGTLHPVAMRRLAMAFAAIAAIFTVGTYDILFGAVVSPLHSRVDFHRHAIALSDVTLSNDGAVVFEAYVDAGPDTGAAYVIAASLEDASGNVIERWDGESLAGLAQSAIVNAWPYAWASKFKTEVIGFSAQTGARATITLAPPRDGLALASGGYKLTLEAIDGTAWSATVTLQNG